MPRWIDLTICLLGTVILWPIFLLTALLVRLDSPGPLLFRQKRVGLGNRAYSCLKFRSMYHNSPPREEKKQILDFRNYVFSPGTSDPRVTPVGRILRTASLDEVPQLLNVIKGEMALVGPRPEVPEIVDQFPPEYFERHNVLPGITGLAQVNGRADLTYHRIVLYDLEYVRHRSPQVDFMILLRTVGVVLRREGAR